MSVSPAATFAAFEDILRNAGSARPELESLSRERDPELFYEGLLSFASRQEGRDRFDLAGQIYGALGGSEPPYAAVAERARRRLDAILGRGAIGPRVEHLARGFFREAASPSTLIGMAGAQAVFGIARTAFLSRLLASPSSGFLTRGFGARALASSAAFALEAPSFVGFVRGANLAMGVEQDWSRQALSRELAGSFLTLGALKLGGAAGTSFHRRMLGPQAAGISQTLFHQASMLGGILLGHGLETRLGIRDSVDGATSLTDALTLLLQFHVSGRLLNSALGPRWAAQQRELQILGERLGERPRQGGDSGQPSLVWATAAPSRALARPPSLAELMSRPLAMSSSTGRNGITPFQGLVKSLLRPELQLRARELLDRVRGSPALSELLPASRALEVSAQADLEGLWTPTWKIGVSRAQWRSLARDVSRKLASHFPEAAQDNRLVLAAGIAMYRELRELRKSGINVGVWTRFLGKVSASDLRALLAEYPRHIVFTTLQLSPERVMEAAPNFQLRHRIAFEEAQSLLPEAYRTELLARTIASQAYRYGDPRTMARAYVEKWREVHSEALSWLRGTEGFEERADTLTRQSLPLRDPLPAVRRRALQLLIGVDPRAAIPKIPAKLRLHRTEAAVEEGVSREQLVASLDEALS
ncbi:MAG TPA: hypothetical protein VFW62_07505, partial [bacterium]|nr:hypothetical protein [bacterium]